MSVTCIFNGRLGNILYNMSQVIAHCKEHNLQWHFPQHAWACAGGQVPITVANTAPQPPFQPVVYDEPIDANGYPYWKEVTMKDNIVFRGYYQSFLYFDKYREDILNEINFPYTQEDIAGIHIRRGDCVGQPDAFPMAPMGYYHAAIGYMQQKGHDHFRVYSDDIPWCREEFTTTNYPGATFEFSEGHNEVQDFISLSGCANIITARSTFSLMAGYFNRNPNKIVLCPTGDVQWWHKQNKDFFTGTEHWLTQLKW